MVQDVLFGTFGGLALFMFGMSLMSDGLKKVAGQKMKDLLESMTRRRLIGFFVGAAVTALIQSSSASTVMIVGFVNAGLLSLKQSISVIIGTNVGTTATAWLVSLSGVSFKISAYAMPAVALGFALQFFGRRRLVREVGQIMLGFGVLFVGISFMKSAFSGLEGSTAVQALFLEAADRPLLAVVAGALVTMCIQSSSAAVASIQLMAVGGAFGADWDTALVVSIPFILGCNIGTTVTAQFSALGASRTARRAAWAHTMFNVLGVLVFVWWIDAFARLVATVSPWQLGSTTVAATIAIAHTMFNIIAAVLFLPLTGTIERVVLFLIREKPGEMETVPVVLEKHLLDTPVIAMEQSRREMIRMAQYARRALRAAVEGMLYDDRKKLGSVAEIEDYIDMMQFEITAYLSELSRRQISDDLATRLPVLLHTVNDLERIGDHATNIVEIAERKIDKKQAFSPQAQGEASELRDEIDAMFGHILAALEHADLDAARTALTIEDTLNTLQIDLRRSHVRRMSSGECAPSTGLVFIDLVDNVEKIGDHLTNIAQAVIGGLQWEGVEPGQAASAQAGSGARAGLRNAVDQCQPEAHVE